MKRVSPMFTFKSLLSPIYKNNSNNINYNGLVSIIIPSYNRYDFLVNSIKSCLNQTYDNIEIIVVDDCSTDPRYNDGSLELFSKTRVIHLPINQREKYNTLAAQGMTRQEGINIARGDWIAFLDDDDFFVENKIEKQLNHLKKHNGLFSSSNMYVVSHNSISEEKLDIHIDKLYFQSRLPSHILTKNLIDRTNYINNSSVLMHKSLIEKTGSFKPVNYEDWDYWKRALYYSNCYYIDEPLVYYTIDQCNKKNYIYK